MEEPEEIGGCNSTGSLADMSSDAFGTFAGELAMTLSLTGILSPPLFSLSSSGSLLIGKDVSANIVNIGHCAQSPGYWQHARPQQFGR